MKQALTIALFVLFILASILGYSSFFLPYFPGITFDKCINDKNDTPSPCKYGEIVHSISMAMSVMVVCVILSYAVMLMIYRNSHVKVNKVYTMLDIPVTVLVSLVSILSIVSYVLLFDYKYPDNNKEADVGIYTRGISTVLFFICFILAIVAHFKK